MITVEFLIKKISDKEMFVLCQDGGIVFIENNENCIVSKYHSIRLPKNADGDILSNIIETDHKAEIYDWPTKRESIDIEILLDAVYWLYCGVDVYVPKLTYYEGDTINMFGWLNNNYLEQ